MIHLEETKLTDYLKQSDREAILTALDTLTWHYSFPDVVSKDMKLSEVAKWANRFCASNLKVGEVENILKDFGFRVSYTHGIKFVRANPDLLETLT